MAQGGKFGRGFAATAVSKGFYETGKGVGKDAGHFANAAEAAFIGGTASVFAGGTFANGAKSAAFARLFNDFLLWKQGTGEYQYWNEETGEMVFEGVGYSGSQEKKGLNNINKEDVKDVGPAPTGTWEIGDYSVSGNSSGSSTLWNFFRLNAVSGQATSNRDLTSFLIHGFDSASPWTASRGCLIMNYTDRMQLKKGDKVYVY